MNLWQTNPFQPLTITRGEGCTVWDTAGKPYLDLLSGTWCSVLGYGHPRWVSAIQEQVSTLTHTGAMFTTPQIYDGLSKLSEILPPSLTRAVFLNTGSEAVELALKMARAATGRDGVVVIERGYYGATTYALSLSEAGRTANYLPQMGTVHRLPAPDCRRCPKGVSWPCGDEYPCLDTLSQMAEAQDESTAAVIYEPMMAAAGMLIPPPGYGIHLRDLSLRCGALLIAEEVTTGVGRTGHWFAFEHDHSAPDILVIGKAIGAGLPVSAVATSEEVEARCQGTLRHVQSHQNDPLSGRVAATVISILQEERLVEAAAERGAYLLDGLKDLQSGSSHIWEARGKGMFVGIELQPDTAERGADIRQRLLEAGFIVDYQPQNSTFRLFPPYIITTQEIDSFLHAFGQLLT